ncbi:DUF2568 domain-containing protein [Micromonospora chalcea]
MTALLLIAVVWGLFCSPRATVTLPDPAKLAVQAACFLAGGVLLAAAGHAVAGVALVALWTADKAALTLTGTPI